MRNEKHKDIIASIFEIVEEIENLSYDQGRNCNNYECFYGLKDEITFKKAEIDNLLFDLAGCTCEVEQTGNEFKKWMILSVFWLSLGNALIVCGYLWYGLFFGASLLEILFC